MAGVRKRKTKASYLDVGKGTVSYALMGTGFTELNEKPSAKNSSKRYINMDGTRKSITGYDWSTPFTADDIREETAIEFICNIGEQMLTGADAEVDYVIVDLDKPSGGRENVFQARKIRVAVAVSEFQDNDGEMGVSGDLLGVGDVVPGTFDTQTRTFTGGGTLQALTVTSVAGTTTGTTKLTVTPALAAGNSYRYQAGADVTLPVYGQDCSSWTAWGGTADITVTAGQKIVVAEVLGSKARKAGSATVNIKA